MTKMVYYRNFEQLNDSERLFIADVNDNSLEDIGCTETWTMGDVADYGSLSVALKKACFDEVITYIGEF